MAGVGRADADIAAGNRVANTRPGRCVWASLETCARHQGIEACRTLAEYDGGAGSVAVARALYVKGVRSRQCHAVSWPFLRRAAAKDRPVMIGVQGVHAVVFLGIKDDRTLRVIDPNRPAKVLLVPRSWWDGWAVEMIPEGEE